MLQKILTVLVQVKKFVALTQLQPKQLSDKSNTSKNLINTQLLTAEWRSLRTG